MSRARNRPYATSALVDIISKGRPLPALTLDIQAPSFPHRSAPFVIHPDTKKHYFISYPPPFIGVRPFIDLDRPIPFKLELPS